jgi:integrase
MSVFKVKSRDLWASKWREDGKQRVKYFNTEAEAASFESDRLAAKAGSDDRVTLIELVVLFYRNNPSKNEHTKKNVLYFLCGHDDTSGRHTEGAGEFLANKYADSLNRRDLELMRDNMRVKNPKVSNATINKYQAYLRGVLSWGVEQDLIAINPWQYKRLKHVKPPVIVRMPALMNIYGELPEYMQWAVKTALCLVVRPGLVELFGLLWSNFDWRRGLVYVKQGKTGEIKTVYPPATYMAEAYQRYHDDTANGIPYVCHRNGRRVLSYRQAWDNACKRANESMRFYDIRHVSITEMLAQGADLASVAAQAGHSSIETTAKNYAHVTPRGQIHAATLIPMLPENDGKK